MVVSSLRILHGVINVLLCSLLCAVFHHAVRAICYSPGSCVLLATEECLLDLVHPLSSEVKFPLSKTWFGMTQT